MPCFYNQGILFLCKIGKKQPNWVTLTGGYGEPKWNISLNEHHHGVGNPPHQYSSICIKTFVLFRR